MSSKKHEDSSHGQRSKVNRSRSIGHFISGVHRNTYACQVTSFLVSSLSGFFFARTNTYRDRQTNRHTGRRNTIPALLSVAGAQVKMIMMMTVMMMMMATTTTCVSLDNYFCNEHRTTNNLSSLISRNNIQPANKVLSTVERSFTNQQLV